MYKSLIRPRLFQEDPEAVHERVTRWLEAYSFWVRGPLSFAFSCRDKRLSSECLGISFPNPVGLAAGFDKNARLVSVLPGLGFGFLEVGTVTRQPQAGQSKPRIFRYPEDQALVNRLGFNNDGALAVAKRLAGARCPVPLGINLGKGKDTPLERAVEDYTGLIETFHPLGDYFTINVSSPNTQDLRRLQDPKYLKDLLSALMEKNTALSKGRPKPLFVKLDPDASFEDLDKITNVLASLPQAPWGLIATNTSLGRGGLKSASVEAGGLSGKPLASRSTEVVRHLRRSSAGRWPIIGVGGVFTAQDAYEKIRAGANLVQIYTGFIYEGPSVVKAILCGLLRLLKQDGFTSVSQAVGAE